MYFTSSISDDIRVPLHINIVCLVLLQPRRRTPHQSCSNDGTVHHNGGVPSAPFPEASDLLPAPDSHTSITTLHEQPNDAEVDKGMPKRLYTRCITLLLCIHVDPSGILCHGTTMVLLFMHLVRRSGAKQNWRIFFLWCLFQRKMVGILISSWTSFSN